MARPLPRPRHTPRCKCVVCARAQGRAQNPFALGAAFAGAIGGAVGGALTGALRNPPSGTGGGCACGRCPECREILAARAERESRTDPWGGSYQHPKSSGVTRSFAAFLRHEGLVRTGRERVGCRQCGAKAAYKRSGGDESGVGGLCARCASLAADAWRHENPSLALVGLGLPNPAGRRRHNPSDEAGIPARVRSALEHAPPTGRTQPGLVGWWLGTNELWYLCAKCAGRIAARGAQIPQPATPVWADPPEPRGVCQGCEVGRPNPAGRRGRAKNPALALVGLGLPNPPRPPRAQNPTNHACSKDRGYRGEVSLEEARERARETGKLAEFEKSVKYYRATHGKAPTSVAVYAYDDGSRQKRVSFGVVFGKSDQIFYEDTPDGKKRNRDGSNKKWVHETSRKAPPSLVWFADTGLLGYVGGALHVNSSGRDAGWLLD